MTKHKGVCRACTTLLVPMTVGRVSARLRRDSRGEGEKDGEGGMSDGRMSKEERHQGQKNRNGKEKREVCG